MTGQRRDCGIYTDRWGWQPHAWHQNGLATYRWRTAPDGLLTRRQMRSAGLAPNRAEPVAQIVTRRSGRRGYLYDPADLAPKRTPSPRNWSRWARHWQRAAGARNAAKTPATASRSRWAAASTANTHPKTSARSSTTRQETCHDQHQQSCLPGHPCSA